MLKMNLHHSDSAQILKRFRLISCIEEEKNDKSFNKIFEDLWNEESVEMLSEKV